MENDNDSASGHTPLSPSSERLLNRRQWLQGALCLVIAGLAGSVSLGTLAASANVDALSAFMTLSAALTEHQHLNPDVGQRLLDALQKSNPGFSAQLPLLSDAIASGSLNAEQQAQALHILQAWYLGTVDNHVITYEQALMFDVASDVLIIRSYCPNKPGFWAEKPASASLNGAQS